MNIAIVSEVYYPLVGGGSTHLQNLVEKMVANQGCNVDFFCRSLLDENGMKHSNNEILLNGALRIFRCGIATNFWNPIGMASYIISLLWNLSLGNISKKYKIVHTHGLLDTPMISFLKNFSDYKHIFTVHGAPNMDKGAHTLKYFFERYILTGLKYDAEIVVGKYFLKYPNVNKNIFVIGNGIDLPSKIIESHTENGIFKILFVGRFDWVKGIDTLIESILLLRENNPLLLTEKNLKVSIVGYGNEEQTLKTLVGDYRLNDIITFTGKKTGGDLISEYVSSNLFVCPSRSEGFGITILEAMIYRVPVISTSDSGGPSDIIESGSNGILIPKDRPEILAETIKDFLLGNYDTEKFIANGKETVTMKYTWDSIAKQIFEVYKKCLN